MDDFAHGFQFAERFEIYLFNFNGDDIRLFAKSEYILILRAIALDKLVGHPGSRVILVLVKDNSLPIPGRSCFTEHFAQLAPATNADDFVRCKEGIDDMHQR